MNLFFIKPGEKLKEYITRFWVLQTNSGLAHHGTLIVPNAKPKIIIPFKSSISTSSNKNTSECKEGDVCFIGVRDEPVYIKTADGISGSIGIELTTKGAYRFLRAPMYHLTNNLLSFGELYGKEGKELLEKIYNEENVKSKITIIEDFLFSQLQKENRNNLLIDYSVNFISSLHGLTSIKQLSKKTGYSKRYLEILFKDHIGISPKSLAAIFRFQSFYKTCANSEYFDPEVTSIYDLYYDQSHFIKEFKRYTGLTPKQYARFNNDFGKNF